MDDNKSQSIAHQRWSILKNALLKKKAPATPPSCSLRLHNSLELFQIQKCLSEVSSQENTAWKNYKYDKVASGTLSMIVKEPLRSLLTEDLQVTDNTGNICIWASEQVMAHYCITNMEKFAGKSVLELGGGYSCLAGLFIAKYGNTKKMVLSDGNKKALTNVKEIVQANHIRHSDIENIRWDEEVTFDKFIGKFDVVICADCLFRDGQRDKLALAVFKLLKSNGEAVIFAPRRGKTFSDFVHQAKRFFGDSAVEVLSRYDETIWKLHEARLDCTSYNGDIHYPMLIKLKKNEKSEQIFAAARYA